MATFELTYENGATNKTVEAVGVDVFDAIRSLGFKNAESFMWSRLVTYKELPERDEYPDCVWRDAATPFARNY